MARELGIFKKVSLADISDGWDDKAYVLMKPMRIEHMRAIHALDIDTNNKELTAEKVKATESIEDIFVSLFVRGKVYDIDGNLVDAEADDIRDLFLLAADRFLGDMLKNVMNPKSQTQLETSSSTMQKPKENPSK